jgi:hypothetical protein
MRTRVRFSISGVIAAAFLVAAFAVAEDVPQQPEKSKSADAVRKAEIAACYDSCWRQNQSSSDCNATANDPAYGACKSRQEERTRLCQMECGADHRNP